MIPANHLFYLRYEKSSIFRCTCRILVNSFGSGNTHVGQTAKPKLHPQLACRREAWGANENAVAVFWPCPINFRSCIWLFFQSMRFQEEERKRGSHALDKSGMDTLW